MTTAPQLVLNYMRITAVLTFLMISTAIVCSFFLVPKTFAISLPDFYYRYWHLLTWVFGISLVFLAAAFYIERQGRFSGWIDHIFIFILVGWLVRDVVMLIKVSDILFAFQF